MRKNTSTTKSAWHDFILFGVIGLGYVAVLIREEILPSKFSFDASRIQSIAQGSELIVGDKSFAVAANVYRFLGLENHPIEAGLLGYSVMVACILTARYRIQNFAPTAFSTLALTASAVLAFVYLGTYAKDLLIVPLAVLCLLPLRRWSYDVVVVAAMIWCGAGFRGYWLLVAAVYVACRLLFKLHFGLRGLLIIAGSAVVCVALGLTFILHVDPDHFRSHVNENRIGSEDAATIILPFVHLVQPLGGIINSLITFVTLILPVPLSLLGSVYHLLSAVIIASLLLPAMLAMPWASGKQTSPLSATAARCASLILAFLVTQSLFEPDYGSALRHLTPLMPLIAVVIVNRRQRLNDATNLKALR